MSEPVLVIGGTGRVGHLVVNELLAQRVPVRALSRRPDSATLPAGVDVVRGDLTAPGSLEQALRDVRSVFLVWTAPPQTIEVVVARLAQQVERLVLLSSPHQTPHPFFQQPNPMAAMHATLEANLKASGVPSSIIRPGMFASNVLHWWAPQLQTGDVVRWPYRDVETAPIDERDLAAVVTHELQRRTSENHDHVLTGPEALSHAEQIRIIGDAIGRQLSFHELSPAAFRHETSATWPPAVVEMLLNAWQATAGTPAYVTTSVANVLGRPARSFRQWASDHADAFQRRAP